METTTYAQPNSNITSATLFDNGKGFDVGSLYKFISDQTVLVNKKLSALKEAGSSVSVTDMFEMQLKMNRFSQFSEMITSVVAAAGAAIQSIARNVK